MGVGGWSWPSWGLVVSWPWAPTLTCWGLPAQVDHAERRCLFESEGELPLRGWHCVTPIFFFPHPHLSNCPFIIPSTWGLGAWRCQWGVGRNFHLHCPVAAWVPNLQYKLDIFTRNIYMRHTRVGTWWCWIVGGDCWWRLAWGSQSPPSASCRSLLPHGCSGEPLSADPWSGPRWGAREPHQSQVLGWARHGVASFRWSSRLRL